jgi:hypothetical protein
MQTLSNTETAAQSGDPNKYVSPEYADYVEY